MADERRVRRVGRALIEQGLQPPGRPLEEELNFIPLAMVKFFTHRERYEYEAAPCQVP